MPASERHSVEDVFNTIDREFIQPVRDRLKTYDKAIIREMLDQDVIDAPSSEEGYDAALKKFLGGIGSGAPEGGKDPGSKPVVRLLWQILSALLRDWGGQTKTTLSAVVLQTFSNAHGRQPGRQMWAAREIALEASPDPAKARVRSLTHAVWYLRSCRLYHPRNHPDNPVGLYNLLMNPQFFDVFRTRSADWYPQPILITKSGSPTVRSTLPKLGLGGLIGQLSIDERLDRCRRDLRDLADSFGLSSEPLWGDITARHEEPYRRVINQFVAESLARPGVTGAIEELRESLAKVLFKDKEGAWSELKDKELRNRALAQLRGISSGSLLQTFLFLLLHEPEWTHYYYFVFGSVPNTSGPSLAIFTNGSLRDHLQVCAQYLLTECGKHLAILETQKLAMERAEERMSYFVNLQTHTFTKGFTTPVHNETMRLEAAVPPAYNQGAAGRAQERLQRFEYAMQSSEFLGVGEVLENVPDTYQYDAERIETSLGNRLITTLYGAARRGIDLRLNDLFDDPRFAECAGIDPTRDIEQFKGNIVIPVPDVVTEGFYADYPLLAYHLQSVVQNATEAIDLVAAWDGQPQMIRVSFEVKSKGGRRYAVFRVANTCAKSFEFPKFVYEAVGELQSALRESRAVLAQRARLSTKSGGHSGMGLLLAATFCEALRVGEARGRLEIHRGSDADSSAGSKKAPDLTVVSMWFPLPKTEPPGADEQPWIDRRVLLLVPGFPTDQPVAPAGTSPAGSDSPSVADPGLSSLGPGQTEPDDGHVVIAEDIEVLIVEDDSADRQRFRLHLQEKYPTPRVFLNRVSFAWDAKNRRVFPPERICEFLSQKVRPTKVFLDLAWDGDDEASFRQLRKTGSFAQYEALLEQWAGDRREPKGLRLLRLLQAIQDDREKEGEESLRVKVMVVTAYKSQYLMKYLKDRYGKRTTRGRALLEERPFMKWSDGERLKDIIGLID